MADAYSLFGFAQSVAFGVGSLLISLVMIFEALGFNNKEVVRSALRCLGGSQFVLNSFYDADK
jgi:hypothetical protein